LKRADLKFRADLMLLLREYFRAQKATPADICKPTRCTPTTRERAPENGKTDKFSADKLIGFAAKSGFDFIRASSSKSGQADEIKCDVAVLRRPPDTCLVWPWMPAQSPFWRACVRHQPAAHLLVPSLRGVHFLLIDPIGRLLKCVQDKHCVQVLASSRQSGRLDYRFRSTSMAPAPTDSDSTLCEEKGSGP